MFKSFATVCLAASAMAASIEHTMLSQVKAQGSANHSCTSSAERARQNISWQSVKDIPDGYVYRDSSFPADVSSLYWAEMYESNPDGLKGVNVQWKSLYDVFGARGRTFLGDGMSPDDINQGVLGNCWFLAAASAIAEVPNRMEKVFLDPQRDLNKNGGYGIRFYTLGVPHTLIIDDMVPLYDRGDGKLKTLFSNPGSDGSMWTAVLEKAFAKHHGNYLHIEGGDPAFAIRTMTGAPFDRYDHKKISAWDLWQKLVAHDKAGDIMSAGSPAGSDKTQSSTGLVQGHAFTVLGVKETSGGDYLVKIRNPHGREHYHGAWGDTDGRWTAALLAEVGHTLNTEDGIFWMDIGNFHSQFDFSRGNFNTDGWGHDYFLMLDDQSAGDGTMPWCGPGCNGHDMTVKSDVDQLVYVAAHLWDKRSIPEKCPGPSGSNSIGPDGKGTNYTFKAGSQGLEAIHMKAGEERNFHLEFDFRNPNSPKDWGFTAYGNAGGVHIYHGDNTPSSSWPGEPARASPPALPGFDSAGFTAFVKDSIAAGQTNWFDKVDAKGYKYVFIANALSTDYVSAYKWQFSFKKADWEKLEATWMSPGFSGSFADNVKCVDGASATVTCEVGIEPQQGVGFVLPKGHSQYYSYGASTYRYR